MCSDPWKYVSPLVFILEMKRYLHCCEIATYNIILFWWDCDTHSMNGRMPFGGKWNTRNISWNTFRTSSLLNSKTGNRYSLISARGDFCSFVSLSTHYKHRCSLQQVVVRWKKGHFLKHNPELWKLLVRLCCSIYMFRSEVTPSQHKTYP